MIEKTETINPDMKIVAQYCLAVYVGSISITKLKRAS